LESFLSNYFPGENSWFQGYSRPQDLHENILNYQNCLQNMQENDYLNGYNGVYGCNDEWRMGVAYMYEQYHLLSAYLKFATKHRMGADIEYKFLWQDIQ
jgi:hypothetical protein